MRLIALSLIFLFVPTTHAALSPEAQSYLNEIPGKQLTLDYVIKLALARAEAYRMLGYDYATAELEELGEVSSLTDTLFTLEGGYSDENAVKTNPFQALRTQQWEWSAGLSKRWRTGTLTSVRWLQDSNNLEFGNLGAFGNSFLREYKQSTAELLLEQSLLRNSFGYAFRQKEKAARARAAGIQWKTRSDMEELTQAFIDQYYQAWLMQQQVSSLKDQVKRQARLVQVMTKRSRKGAVEKPDLIQLEALLAATRTRLSKAKNDLAQLWEKLAVTLALPDTFLTVNPMDIPTTIDNPVPLSLRVCGLKEPVKTAEIHALEKQLEGLTHDFKAAKNESLPDLKLVAGYRGNAIDSRAAVNFQNVIDGHDENGIGNGPAWNVGMRLAWPLNNSAARALRTTRYIQKKKLTSQLQVALDDLKTQWRDHCRRLRVEAENAKVFANIVKEQKSRLKAEERRFRLGRIRVDQLVSAENDLGDWEFQSQQKKIAVRQLAWKVQQASGDMYRYLAPQVGEMLESGVQ